LAALGRSAASACREDRPPRRCFVDALPDAGVCTTTEGEPIERNGVRGRVWPASIRAAGMTGFDLHDLRRRAGMLAARTSATTEQLMAQLGHASPNAAVVLQRAGPTGTGASRMA
jgi:integrase